MRPPVVFLDFDGVLNSTGFLLGDGRAGLEALGHGEAQAIDPVNVARLNRLVSEIGADVVVSSSWRHGRTVGSLWRLLRARGFTGKVIGTTPNFVRVPTFERASGYGERGHEIREWLRLAKHESPFVVLDDNSDMAGVEEHFVQTSMDAGLTDADVDRAIAIIRGQS